MSDVVDSVRWLWEAFRAGGKGREESKIATSLKVREAITETEIYLISVNRNQKRDFDSEATLSRKWSLVAAEVAPKDENILNACLSRVTGPILPIALPSKPQGP